MMKKRTIKQKTIYRRFFSIFVLITITCIFLISFNAFDKEYFISEGYKSIQFNMLTVNSVLLGFMFTSLGIFISASQHEIIKKEAGYVKYDLLVISIVIGLISVGFSMLVNIFVIIVNMSIYIKFSSLILFLEIMTLTLGVVMFIWTILDSIYILKLIRKSDKSK